jgi:hypothetical protein
MISIEVPLGKQHVSKFLIPLGVSSTCRLPNSLILQYQTTPFWDYVNSQVNKTYPANIDDLKQWIQEFIQWTHKETLHVMAYCPLHMQRCVERHSGHI